MMSQAKVHSQEISTAHTIEILQWTVYRVSNCMFPLSGIVECINKRKLSQF